MGRTFAISDLHGRYDIFQLVKDFLQPEDRLYVLGDCCDRGPDGWKILKEVARHPQMLYLKGNHEDMFADAIMGDAHLCYLNGGLPTVDAWHADGANEDWYQFLRTLPTHLTYMNKRHQKVELTHAGYTPHIGVRNYQHDLLWDREHFFDAWDKNYPDTIIVHGHTPIPLMSDVALHCTPEDKKDCEALWYGEGHKVNIDAGCVWTGQAILLDLDTWEEHIFKV